MQRIVGFNSSGHGGRKPPYLTDPIRCGGEIRRSGGCWVGRAVPDGISILPAPAATGRPARPQSVGVALQFDGRADLILEGTAHGTAVVHEITEGVPSTFQGQLGTIVGLRHVSKDHCLELVCHDALEQS